MRRLIQELLTAHSLLDALGNNVEAASLTYIDHLNEILESFETIESDAQYARSLVDQLQAARAELLKSVTKPKTWATVFRIINPKIKIILPPRFIRHTKAQLLELPVDRKRA